MFRKFDAGAGVRIPANKGRDCSVRALCTATGMRYSDAWTLLYTHQGENRLCHMQLGLALDAQDPRFGVVRKLSFPAQKGQPRMTPATFCLEYPRGSYILNLAQHDLAVEDGHYFDTWDCGTKCVYCAWEVRKAA
jgi:hypothetical protein